jgi:hypothetical protein
VRASGQPDRHPAWRGAGEVFRGQATDEAGGAEKDKVKLAISCHERMVRAPSTRDGDGAARIERTAPGMVS